ncbi:MAG: hypothetical protein AAF604_06640 [Acidobacteriota bacterium]
MSFATLNERFSAVARGVLMLVALVALSCSSSPSAADEFVNPTHDQFSTGYAAVWKQASGESRIASTSSLPDFFAENAVYEQQGFRLVDIEVQGGTSLYVGLWHELPAGARSAEARILVGVPLSSLHHAVAMQEAQGYQVVDFEIYYEFSDRKAAVVLHPGSAMHRIQVDVTDEEFGTANSNNRPLGFRLADLESYRISGESLFAAVWVSEAGPSHPIANTDLRWQNVKELSEVFANDFHLADLEIKSWHYCDDKISAFTVLWERPGAPTSVSFPIGWTELAAAKDAPPGTEELEPVSWLLNDIELLWHAPGSIESALGLDHDGPLIPPEED